MAAQRQEEEAEVRLPEAAKSAAATALCANNCGFHGSPATKNMCQSCFQAEESCSSGREKGRSGRIRMMMDREEEGRGRLVVKGEERAAESSAVAGRVNRCFGCRKKVGLTGGFRCRCGEMFCGEHRYSDRHVCSYDYKAAGREAIARDNPLIRAAKIVRI